MTINPAPAIRAMTAREWGMLLILSLLWGGSFLFMGMAVHEVPFLTLVASRVVIGALALHVVLAVKGLTFPKTAPILLAFLCMGILNNVIPFSLIAFGQGRIESGLASILNATTPIFTMVLAHVFTRDEKLAPLKVIGVVLGFCGVASLFEPGKSGNAQIIGQVACLGAALSYGFAGIFGRRFAQAGLHPFITATGQLTASSLIMLPLALMMDAPFSLPLPSPRALGALLALGLVSTAGAYLLFFRILAKAGATNASLVTLLVPCSAVVLGALVLGEAINLRALFGLALIAFGLLMIDGRILRWRPHAR